MSENKKSFVAYCDWGEIFDDLNYEEAGKLAKHLFDYVRDKNPKSDKLTKLLFIQIKQSLKRDLKKYDKYIDKQRVNGSKGGRPKKPKESEKTQPFLNKPKKADSVNVSVNVSVNDIKEKKFFKFWDLYPKKVNKKDSLKKWMKLSDDDILEISKTIKNFINYKPFEDYTHPNPTTYLNQRRWEDVIPVSKDQSEETMEELIERRTKEAKELL